MTELAPIILFVFNRPEHTAATLEALARNELASDSELRVYADGPRRAEEAEAVARVRAVARAATGFRRVCVTERPANMGLARSVIAGVTETVHDCGRAIVVEDDLVTSPFFLRFMNDALQRYADEDAVWSVCGYAYPLPGRLPDSYFLLGAHPWGWATWRRAWDRFEHDQAALLHALDERDRFYEFDLGGSLPHSDWLWQSAHGRGDSWALRWMATAVVHGGLTLYPGRSLVQNAGMDTSGTNAPQTSFYDTALADRLPRFPDGRPAQDDDVFERLRAYHIAWRRTWNLRQRVYYGASAFVPRAVERRLYSAVTRRALGRAGWQRPSLRREAQRRDERREQRG